MVLRRLKLHQFLMVWHELSYTQAGPPVQEKLFRRNKTQLGLIILSK